VESLKIYQLYIENEPEDIEFYDEYMSDKTIDKDSIAYCIGSSVSQECILKIKSHIDHVYIVSDLVDKNSLRFIYLMESLTRNKGPYLVIDPLEDATYDVSDNAGFRGIYESILSISNTNILSVNFKSLLSYFSECIGDIDDPLWRGNFRDIYRYLSCLHDTLSPLSDGASHDVDTLSDFNILKSTKDLVATKFPRETLEKICGSSKPHKIHIELQTIIKTVANEFSRNIDNGEFPLFYLWLYLMFDFKVKHYIENGCLNDASVFLVRMIEVLAQAALLSDGYIRHKGYGRFCGSNGDDKNLMGAGSYMLLFERYSYTNSDESILINKIIKSRNQLLTAHGFSTLSDKDFVKIYNSVSIIAKRVIKSKVKKEIYDGFEKIIDSLNNAEIIDFFFKKNIESVNVLHA